MYACEPRAVRNNQGDVVALIFAFARVLQDRPFEEILHVRVSFCRHGQSGEP